MLRMKWLLPAPAAPRTAITSLCWRGRRLSGLTFGLVVFSIIFTSYGLVPKLPSEGENVREFSVNDSFKKGGRAALSKSNRGHFSTARAGVQQFFTDETEEISVFALFSEEFDRNPGYVRMLARCFKDFISGARAYENL
jgi:hypothetical protein